MVAEVSLNDHQNNCTVKQDEKNDARQILLEVLGCLLISCTGVEWSGDVVQIVDGKLFYQSCCIGGVTYKLQDHALLHSSPDRLIPSKLQAVQDQIPRISIPVNPSRNVFPFQFLMWRSFGLLIQAMWEDTRTDTSGLWSIDVSFLATCRRLWLPMFP
ncbi:hypothetical protein Dsin_032525 [Dipteronia sinensis]|uniref:Uncharacterized protein n=1 Tax=Dipteronia sinensis TaxID=43782 RepID=A0AAD9ZEN3_9ROSI|nr:hypothetical protein Dsin_032525 [Dipteronia sinensis]